MQKKGIMESWNNEIMNKKGRKSSFRSHERYGVLRGLYLIVGQKNRIGYPFFSAEVGMAGAALGSPAKRARRIFLRRERAKATFPGRARVD
jgi:hypothetical protein